MNKIAVVFWSSTGNTQAMADSVMDGITQAGAEGTLITAVEFSADMMDNYDAIAFGCPSMGSEELEESEFAPMFESCEAKLNGKKIALFGSYGWGDGQWMRDWVDRMSSAGATVLNGEGLICNETPDSDVLADCENLGKQLAANA